MSDCEAFRQKVREQGYDVKREIFRRKVQEYAKKLESDGKAVTYFSLRDAILGLYQDKNGMLSLDNDRGYIISAIEEELAERDITVEKIIEEFEKIVREYRGEHKFQGQTIISMLSDDRYSDYKGKLEFSVDSKYINFAIHAVLNPLENQQNAENAHEM